MTTADHYSRNTGVSAFLLKESTFYDRGETGGTGGTIAAVQREVEMTFPVFFQLFPCDQIETPTEKMIIMG